jgi:hypothetical protein
VDGSSHRHRERLLAVPSGLIEQHDGVGVLREARGEAIEEYVHGVGIDLGEDEREGIVGGRPHGGIEVGGEGLSQPYASPTRASSTTPTIRSPSCMNEAKKLSVAVRLDGAI